jgi:FkbM family methyltransferase
MPGSPLETELASCETVFTGPKGTFVAFDGARLLHRGGLVATGSRVALQVVFSPKPSIPVRRRVMSTVRGFLKRPRDLARNLRTRIKGEKFSTVLQSFSRALPQISCIDVGASYFPHEKWRLFLDSPNVHWLAVEPNEANLEYIRHWRWAAIPTVLGTGLSRTGGRQTLFVTNIDSGSSLLPPVFGESMQHRVTDATRSYFYPVREVEVDTLTLADVVAETVPTSPVCVKLDTQGSELEILRGAHDLLSRHRFVGLEIESSLLAEPVMRGGSRFWEVNEYLESLGYELLHIDPIMSGSNFSGPSVRGRRWLNECDAVFMLRRDMVDALPAQYRIALLAFQLAYDFFEEALSILQDDIGVRTLLEESQLPPLMLEKAIGRQLSGGTV